MTIISNEPKSTVCALCRATCSPLSQSELVTLPAAGILSSNILDRVFPVRPDRDHGHCHTPTGNMAALTQTCKIALPARVAKRSARTARRTAVVAKAAAPVDAVRVQQKVRDEPC